MTAATLFLLLLDRPIVTFRQHGPYTREQATFTTCELYVRWKRFDGIGQTPQEALESAEHQAREWAIQNQWRTL